MHSRIIYLLFLVFTGWFATSTTGDSATSSAESNLLLLDTENPSLVKIAREADAGLSASLLEVDLNGLKERNRRGVYFSRGIASPLVDDGLSFYNVHGFWSLLPVDGSRWSTDNFMVESPLADQNALFFFNPLEAEPFHGLPALDWIFSGDDGIWLNRASGQSVSDYAAAVPFDVPGAEHQSQLFKRFEFPRFAGALSSNQTHTDPVATDYKNLDPTARKLIIVVHGWSSKPVEDPYSASGLNLTGGDEMADLVSELHAVVGAWNSAYDLQWDLYAYNWVQDSWTGPPTGILSHESGGVGTGVENGTQAAEIGFQHGLVLGKRLKELYPEGLDAVHFIAHSAGTWVARSASLYLQGAYASEGLTPPEQQVTLLDPYNPEVGFDDWDFWKVGPGGEDSVLGTSQIEEWPSLLSGSPQVENVYSIDWFVTGTNETYAPPFANFLVGGSTLGVNVDLFTAWNGHGGPINYYASTVRYDLADVAGTRIQDRWSLFTNLLKGQDTVKFQDSLFWRDVLDHEATLAESAGFLRRIQFLAHRISAANSDEDLQTAVVELDDGWVRALMIPSDGGPGRPLGPARLKPDLTFVLTGADGLVLEGSVDVLQTPAVVSLYLNGSAFAIQTGEVTGTSGFAGSSTAEGANGTRIHSITLKNNEVVVAAEGIQLDGSQWGATGVGAVDATGTFTATSGNGFDLTGSLQQGGALTNEQIAVTPPTGVVATPSSFHDWVAAHGLSGAGAIGELDDPDYDGVENIFEFYRGSSPSVADEEPFLTPVVKDDGRIAFRYWRSRNAQVSEDAVEWSTNLVDWARDGGTLGSTIVRFDRGVIASTSAAVKYEVVPATGMDAAGKGFLRFSLSWDPGAPEGFVEVPAGTFSMGDSFGEGDPNEAPVHEVELPRFFIKATQVSREEWNGPAEWGSTHGYDISTVSYSTSTRHNPMTYKDWYDIVKWCNAMSEQQKLEPCYSLDGNVYRTGKSTPQCNFEADGYRLPTEAEWEKAARGGKVGARFPWGDTITHDRANYFASRSQTYDVSATVGDHPVWADFLSPVGSFPPNDYGVFDMAGNSWEYCQDRYGSTYYQVSPRSDPKGPTTGFNRVLRGGAYRPNISSIDAYQCRVSYRTSIDPRGAGIMYGFRVSRRPTPQ